MRLRGGWLTRSLVPLSVLTTAARSRMAAAAVFSVALHVGALQSLGIGGAGTGSFSAESPMIAPALRVRLASPAASAPARHASTASPQESDTAKKVEPPSTAQSSPGPSGVMPVPRYYLSSELEQRPAPLKPIDPEYPLALQSQKHVVVLQLFINEQGSVDEVKVLGADPEGAFEQSARTAFANARFSPGLRDGAPVRAQMKIEVTFDPGIEPLPSEPAQSGAAAGTTRAK